MTNKNITKVMPNGKKPFKISISLKKRKIDFILLTFLYNLLCLLYL